MFKQFSKIAWKVIDVVNTPSRTQRITRTAVVSRVILKDYMDSVKIMEQKGIFAGSLGEVSLRVSGGKFLINPRKIPLSFINDEMLLFEGYDKETYMKTEEQPVHIDWHRMVYHSSMASAVVLCQPAHATLIANSQKELRNDILIDGKNISEMAKFALPEEMSEMKHLPDESIFFVKTIGILCWGKTIHDLFDRILILDRLCEILSKF